MSRFVSGGTNEEPTERDEEWLKAQEEIEAKRDKKIEVGQQEGGKSLYETLQANKAAKQEAFEESARLRNQFRSLDEDEVEYLDAVLESTREKEAEVKKQTVEQLEAFRKQQEEAERAAKQDDAADAPESAETWSAGPRKRKKGRENIIGGVKVRRTSTAERQSDMIHTEASITPQKLEKDPRSHDTTQEAGTRSENEIEQSAAPVKLQVKQSTSAKTPSPPAAGLGLAAYSSDEDD